MTGTMECSILMEDCTGTITCSISKIGTGYRFPACKGVSVISHHSGVDEEMEQSYRYLGSLWVTDLLGLIALMCCSGKPRADSDFFLKNLRSFQCVQQASYSISVLLPAFYFYAVVCSSNSTTAENTKHLTKLIRITDLITEQILSLLEVVL